MRLLVVTQYFWPEDFRVNELVAELGRRGHEVVVLTGRPNYPEGRVFPEYAMQPGRFASYHAARVVRVPMVARGRGTPRLLVNYASFAFSATLFGICRFRRDRFDAILVNQLSPITVGIPAIALRRLKGWPIAFWVLDQWPESLSAVGMVTSPSLLRLVGRLVSFIYARCDLILSPAKSMIGQIAKYHVAVSRIRYLPNWVESTYTASDSATAAPEVAVRPGSFNVMFAGNIGASQDFPAILDAAAILAEHRSIRWLIVGDGRMAEWVRAEVQRRGLQDAVVMLGRHSVERMPSFYTHADALLVALKPEPVFAQTLPGKVQSYLAAGVPILAMLDGEGAAVIAESGAGLACRAGDARGLADAVLRLAAMSAEERRVMGDRGRAFSLVEFDRDRLIGRLESWLCELAADPARVG